MSHIGMSTYTPLSADQFVSKMIEASKACRSPVAGRLLSMAAAATTERNAEHMALEIINRLSRTDDAKEADRLMTGLKRVLPKTFEALRNPREGEVRKDLVGWFVDASLGHLWRTTPTATPKIEAVVQLLREHSGRDIAVNIVIPNEPNRFTQVNRVFEEHLRYG